MIKRVITIILGIAVAILPYLGIPTDQYAGILPVLGGLVVVVELYMLILGGSRSYLARKKGEVKN